MFGVGVGGAVSRIDYVALTNRLEQSVAGALLAQFRSDEQRLRYYRRPWHEYRLPRMDGRWCWRYHVIDLRSPTPPGTIYGRATSTGIDSDYKREYIYEGGCRDQRFLLLGRPTNGTEPSSIMIMPFMGDSFRRVHAGFRLLQTWDGDHAVVPVIMTEKPLDAEAGGSEPLGEEGRGQAHAPRGG